MRSTESGFNELVYLAAAEERLSEAGALFRQEHYVMAAYVSGVAVEALLLAYQMREGAAHDAKHSLARLAENGKFWEGMTRKQREAIAAALGEVMTRWRNNHRYRSERAFLDYLVRERLFVSEDIVRSNTGVLIESAYRVIETGVARWSLPSV